MTSPTAQHQIRVEYRYAGGRIERFTLPSSGTASEGLTARVQRLRAARQPYTDDED